MKGGGWTEGGGGTFINITCTHFFSKKIFNVKFFQYLVHVYVLTSFFFNFLDDTWVNKVKFKSS